MRVSRILLLAAAVIAVPPAAYAVAQPAPAAANAEDTRLTAFLDGEFAQEVKMRPTLATRLGIKENQDKLDDNSDAGALRMLASQLRHLGAGAGAGRAQLQVPPLPAAFLFLPLFGARAAAELHDQHPHGV